ncbi:MAG: hypothetical protein CL797_08165 [Chromatiales bacterium]|jgi:hypothetical protein|nr:hypothetical protein [Chromatiales bacterium]
MDRGFLLLLLVLSDSVYDFPVRQIHQIESQQSIFTNFKEQKYSFLLLVKLAGTILFYSQQKKTFAIINTLDSTMRAKPYLSNLLSGRKNSALTSKNLA